MEIENTKRSKQKPAFFVLRAAAAFILLLALIAGLYLIGFRSYRTVAEWGDDGNHATLIYQDETYTLIGAIGDKGLTESKYPIDKILGKVEDDGSVMTDAEVTFPEETVEGETLNVPPPRRNSHPLP